MLLFTLDIQTAYKRYFTIYNKEFHSREHLDNWMQKMFESKGWKVIGIQETTKTK
jgi:hypothetical protein